MPATAARSELSPNLHEYHAGSVPAVPRAGGAGAAAQPGVHAQAEVDVDFVLHGVAGGHPCPAARWAELARPGDEAVLCVVATGWCTAPLLAGDETAVPAVCAVLEGLPDGADVTALLEVPTTADRLPVARPAGADVRWFARDGGGHAHDVIARGNVPQDGGVDSDVVVRRHLIGDLGLPRGAVACMGYWRHGRAEDQ